MNPAPPARETRPPAAGSARVAAALAQATDTREVVIGEGALDRTADVFRRQFGGAPAIVIADVNTFRIAGRAVAESLRRAGIPAADPVVFEDPDLHAESAHVERLERALRGNDAIPVAVGAGVINDLAKLAAHRAGRPYLAVATAASVDGYTAFGASITHEGSKQTFLCPAPRAVVADTGVLGRAPAGMNAAGYGDLAGKITGGADWILADALGVEPIDAAAWEMVQADLRGWLSAPGAIRRGDPAAMGTLLEALLMTGFAMQKTRSSRPASGAEHQFSHLWDMQEHRHDGRIPPHGFKVGVGTVAVTLLYEDLIERPLERLDVEAVCRRAPDLDAVLRRVRETHAIPDLQAVALRESEAKHLDPPALRKLLERLRAVWPDLRERLRRHLIPSGELRRMLQKAGTPADGGDIGIDDARMRRTYVEAQQIRRRFTVLDLATFTGLMPDCLERLFAPGGGWDRMRNGNA